MSTDNTFWADELETKISLKDGIDLSSIFWRRKWVIIACCLIGFIGGFLRYYSATPLYSSGANVLIERKRPAMQLGLSSMGFDRYQLIAESMKHPVILSSPEIASNAYKNHKLSQCNSLSVAESPVGEIMSGLSVEPLKSVMGVYSVSFTGTDRQDTAKVVDAILESYRVFLEESHEDVGRETRELITRGKDELRRELAVKEQAYQEFRANAPLMWKDGTGTNLHQARQVSIESARAETNLKISVLDSKLRAAREALRGGDLDGLITIAVNSDRTNLRPVALVRQNERQRVSDIRSQKLFAEKQSLVRAETTIMPLKLEEEELVAKYGKDHPKTKSVRRRISKAESFLHNMAEVEREYLGDNALNNDIEVTKQIFKQEYRDWQQQTIRGYVSSLRQQVATERNNLEKLDQLFEEEENEAKALAGFQAQDEAHRKDIERTQQLFDKIVENLEQVNLDDGDGYNFRVISAPAPGYKVSPTVPKTFSIALVLGGLFGTCISYLLEKNDQSFRSPIEISRYLQTPVIGNIPVIEIEDDDKTEATAALDNVLCTAHNPRSPEAEAYRTVRTALFFDARGSDHHIIQVTSPRPGDGKSTLSANLAITVAQGGKKTLLIDADFRRPTGHKVFGFKCRKGMAAVVQGKAEPMDVLNPISGVPNLTVIACGQRPTNPSELLSSKEFLSALEFYKERFDFVIVDTPPLLAVSDPRPVAASVDGVVLTMRIDKEARPVAKRSLQILREVGANIVGIVVNGVNGGIDKKERNNYYDYGAHTYGYNAYKYGYGAAYGYGDDYEDENENETEASELGSQKK